MNFNNHARKIKLALKKSFGENGKATIISKSDGHYYTRDGFKIVEAMTAGSSSPIAYEAYRNAKVIAEEAGDGSTSGSLAFLNGFIFADGERVNEEELNASVKKALGMLKNKQIGIGKSSIRRFVNTCCGKTINQSTASKLVELLYNDVFCKDNHCSLSSDLDYTENDDDSQISVRKTNGFGIEFHAHTNMLKALEEKSPCNWLLSFMDSECSLEEFLQADSMMKQSIKTEKVSSGSKLLIIASSISHELSVHLRQQDLKESKTFAIYMPSITSEWASELVLAMRNATGATVYLDNLLKRLRFCVAFGNGHDIREDMLREFGQSFADEFGEEFNNLTASEELLKINDDLAKIKEEIESIDGEEDIESTYKALQAKHRALKEEKENEFNERSKILESAFNKVGFGNGIAISSVRSAKFKGKTVFISGFVNSCNERKAELRIKNENREIKDFFTKSLQRRIGIIYSDSSTSSISIRSSVPFSKRQDIKDSIKDAVDAFHLMRASGHAFVKGDFITIKELIEEMHCGSNEERLLVRVLKKTRESYLESKLENCLEYEDKGEEVALDSSLSIEYAIRSARDGILYRKNNITDFTIIEGVDNVNQ